MEGVYMFVHISMPLSKLPVVGHGCRPQMLTSEAQTKKSIADIGISAPSAKLI
jgi:hypothetical protein